MILRANQSPKLTENGGTCLVASWLSSLAAIGVLTALGLISLR
jgi:hypothetical protein